MENSVYGIVYSSNELNQVAVVEELVGKKLNSISSNNSGIIAAGTDGYHVVTEYEVVSFKHINFESVAAGKGFLIGIENKSRMLYSWGHGNDGQLGQGVCKTMLPDPLHVNYKAEFASVSCGDAFTVALDKNGNGYSWGENTDRQLGLYTKKQSDMCLKNAVIEDLIFSPRLVPFTLAHPVRKVACGPNFAVAVTKAGEVYAWGAGECGQLGFGRCTKQEIPTRVPLSDESTGQNVSMIDVACGAGHSLAVAENGSLYRWGLNKSGQLGLGDTNTRYSPVGRREVSSLRKVIAEGHSSAAIDEEGRLYTWGSNDFGRLMQAEEKKSKNQEEGEGEVAAVVVDEAENIINAEFPGPPKKKFIPTFWEPRLVEHKSFHSCVVNNFAFSKTGSAALVPTTVTQTIPSSGPKRTFSQVCILGYGLWNSPTIIIKFSSKIYSAYNPPRSCTGTWSPSSLGDCSGIISCKPPKFAECGTYCVSVSMDGANFLPQILEVEVYPDLNVVAQTPDLLDIRQCGADSTQPPLTLRVSGLDSSASVSSEFFVKMAFFDMSVNDDRDYKSRKASPLPPAFELLTKGHLIPDAEPAEVALDENGEPIPVKDVVGTILCDPFDTAFLQDSNCTYEMKCRISRNEQDYSVIAVEKNPGAAAAVPAPGAEPSAASTAAPAVGSTIYHCFTPSPQQPACCYCTDPLEKYLHDTKDDEYVRKNATLAFEREVTLVGSSFLPSSKLPKGCSIEAHLSIPTEPVAEDEEPAAAAEPPVVLPVTCDSISSLRFTLLYANVLQFHQTMTGSGLTELSVNVDFCLKKTGTKDLSVLSRGQVTYTLFKNQAVVASPSVIKHGAVPAAAAPSGEEGSEEEPAAAPPLVNVVSISKKDGSPYTFTSPTAVVRMHYPAAAQREPVVLTDVMMVPVQGPASVAAAAPVEEGEAVEGQNVDAAGADTEAAAPTQFTLQAALGPSDPSVDLVYVSVSLDGSAPVPAEDTWAKVYFYSSVGKYSVTPAAVPKGGFPAGASISLVLEKFVPACGAGQCVVRIRGTSPAAFVDVPATMSGEKESSISFVVPDGSKLAGLDPVMNAKDKLFFVDVSIDGGISFDSPDAAQLQLK